MLHVDLIKTSNGYRLPNWNEYHLTKKVFITKDQTLLILKQQIYENKDYSNRNTRRV